MSKGRHINDVSEYDWILLTEHFVMIPVQFESDSEMTRYFLSQP